MKTKEELSEWLKEQPWFNNFKNNFSPDECENITECLQEDFLSGKLGESTLLEAFVWHDTPEGFKFWQNANTSLLNFLRQ